MSDIEYELSFTDQTLLEADGDYKEVCQKMMSEFPHPEKWMLTTFLTIDSAIGLAQFELHFFSDKKLIIMQYSPSQGDVFYNPDLQILSEWAQENGWTIPEPNPDLVKTNIEFWKHYWQTGLVDSAYLDEVFGIREHFKAGWEEEKKDEA